MQWVNVNEKLPTTDGKFNVKLSDESTTHAYFYKDQIGWIAYYGLKTCHWWDCKTKEPLHNVTHWMPLSK